VITVEQFWAASELAVLDILEHDLGIALVALAAACPELDDPDIDRLEDPQSWAALELLQRVRALSESIPRYRLAVVTAQQRAADMPF
jgi:hypothetical protein